LILKKAKGPPGWINELPGSDVGSAYRRWGPRGGLVRWSPGRLT